MDFRSDASAKIVTARSERKRQAIMNAAEQTFLAGGYLGTSMDDLASRSGVSKQTIYSHFRSKEALFVELVTSMTSEAGDRVHNEVADPVGAGDLEDFLIHYAERQLATVLTPRILQLRRLVIGEVGRFPELASALWQNGPERAIDSLARVFGRLGERGLLVIADPVTAATQFNWLVMSGSLNRAMLLGDKAIPSAAERLAEAEAGVRIFLAAYGS
jgi:TetR/AcrR family transcriptional repressor of mexJK operon